MSDPNIPSPPQSSDKNQYRFNQAVKEAMDVLQGKSRGTEQTRALRVGDLGQIEPDGSLMLTKVLINQSYIIDGSGSSSSDQDCYTKEEVDAMIQMLQQAIQAANCISLLYGSGDPPIGTYANGTLYVKINMSQATQAANSVSVLYGSINPPAGTYANGTLYVKI